MGAPALRHPNSAPRIGQGQDHQGLIGATPSPTRPTRHFHSNSGAKRTHHHTTTNHGKTHAARGARADAHGHREEGDTPCSNTNPVQEFLVLLAKFKKT